jgi:hypothetical protein
MLDFGLAKAIEPAVILSPTATMSPTITTPAMTQAGPVLGTAANMSPGQARGTPVDGRTDVWAFECVLYEVLTGRRAFGAEDVSLTRAEVMKSEPDWAALPGLPPLVGSFLRQCVKKDPKQRLGETRDVRLALDGAFDVPVGLEWKLSVDKRRSTPLPTLVFCHGGAGIARTEAPAAVEDALCALRFVVATAKEFDVDTGRIIVSGESAGGSLALAAGVMPESAGFTRACADGGFSGLDRAVTKVTEIINWYGVSDVAQMLGGANGRSYAVRWVVGDPQTVAKSVSPLTTCGRGLPAIQTIQADADPIVLHSQNVRLRDALTDAGAPNELFIVPVEAAATSKSNSEPRLTMRFTAFSRPTTWQLQRRPAAEMLARRPLRCRHPTPRPRVP